jgi:hypothetical protein
MSVTPSILFAQTGLALIRFTFWLGLFALLLFQFREDLLDIFWFGGRADLSVSESAWLSNLAFWYHRHRRVWWLRRRADWLGLLAFMFRFSAKLDRLGLQFCCVDSFLLWCHKISMVAPRPNYDYATASRLSRIGPSTVLLSVSC